MEEWAPFFNISDRVFARWREECKGGQVTTWALKQGKIDRNKYLHWASHRYELPVLKKSFFSSFSLSRPLWDQVRHQASWQEDFVPLYQWGGLVFCGCVKPPLSPLPPHFVLVLAEPEELHRLWLDLQKLRGPKKWTDPQVSLTPQKNTPPPPEGDPDSSPGTLMSTFTRITRVTNLFKMFQTKNPPANTASHPVFKQAKAYFTEAVIFGFHQNQFVPIQWSPTLAVPACVSVSEASMFKIVCKSRKEFHGLVVPNPIHFQFFKSCGFKQGLPKHITLIPVFQPSGELCGAFMGISPKAPVPSRHLGEIRSWTKDFPTTLFKESPEGQAA